MFGLGIAILGISFYVACFIIQFFLYKISLNYLFKIELSDIFKEINTKKVISNSIWIIYLLPIIISIPIDFITEFIKIESGTYLFLIFSLLHYVIPFFVLFYYHWKEFTLEDESESIRTKAFVVFYFAFLPYAIIIVFMILFYILLFLRFFS